MVPGGMFALALDAAILTTVGAVGIVNHQREAIDSARTAPMPEIICTDPKDAKTLNRLQSSSPQWEHTFALYRRTKGCNLYLNGLLATVN